MPTLCSIVDENGKVVLGTLTKECNSMDFLKINRPTSATRFMNRPKLILRQVIAVNIKDGLLLTVVCDKAIFEKTMNVLYDKRMKKV